MLSASKLAVPPLLLFVDCFDIREQALLTVGGLLRLEASLASVLAIQLESAATDL